MSLLSNFRLPYREDTIFGLTFLLSIILSLAFSSYFSEGHEAVRMSLLVFSSGVMLLLYAFAKWRSVTINFWLFVLLGLFLGVNVLSTLFSVDLINSIFGYYDRYTSSVLFFFCWIVWIAFCGSAIARSEDKALALYKVYLGVAAAAAILMVIHWFGLGYYTGPNDELRPIIPGFIGNQNFTAMFLVGAMPLSIAVWNRATTNLQKIKWFAILLILLVGVGFSASRGAMLGLVASVAVIGVLAFFKKTPSYVWKGLIVVVFIFVVLSVGFSSALRAGAGITPDDQGGGDTIQYRLIAWDHSLNIISEHPILGLGPGNFFLGFKQAGINTLPDGERFDDAHNLYLHIMVGSGIFGGVLFLLSLALVIYIGVKNYLHSGSLVILSGLAGLVALSVAFGFNPVSIPNWIIFGFLYAAVTLHSSKTYSLPLNYIPRVSSVLVGLVLMVYAVAFIVSGYFGTRSVGYYRSGLYNEAYDYALFAKTLNPLNTIANAYLAASSVRSSLSPELSRSYIDAYIALHPSSSGQQKNASDLYLMLYEKTQERKDLVNSGYHLESSVAYEPNNSSLYMRAGYSYVRAGEFSKAMEYLKKAVILNPTNDIFYNWVLMAQLYQKEHMKEQAIFALEKAQAKRPDPVVRIILNKLKQTDDISKVEIPLAYPPIDIN